MLIIMSIYKKFSIAARFVSAVLVFALFLVAPGYATTAVFEVGEGTLPATPAPGAGNPTVFTTINFKSAFAAPPNVFPVTLENGANPDPCVLRIRNVTTTGFDAACLEPINEDRAAGGMVFEYIAVQDGGVTVPLASGVGSVDFVSGCTDITNQTYGPNCVNCSGPISFTPVTFPSAFGATPALLTHVQTTNNIVSSDPIFIDAAVATGSLSSTGFNLALDQMEAGTGPIADAETVCYLAAERNGCQDLDFSSFEGPASVMFQAQNGARDIDGHDNGCTSGEGVDFAAGCFTSTPIAVAKQITRAGNNGGWVRRCSVNTSEVILTIDEDQVSNAERSHIDEEASVFAFDGVFSTPVSFARAKVEQRGRRVTFEWETSAEAFHLGFALWGEVNGEWVQLNKRFIASSGLDTAQATNYSQKVWLSREQLNGITQFGISSIDTQGYEEFFGPFKAGVDYGKKSTIEPVNWSNVRAEYEQNMRDQGYLKSGQRWRKASNKKRELALDKSLNLGRPVLNLEISDLGIQSVSGAEILAIYPRLEGIKLARLAVTLNGQAVVRSIQSDDGRLSADDQIIFYAKSPQGSDGIYLDNYIYQLSLNRAKAIDATKFSEVVEPGASVSNQAMVEKTLTSIQQHSAVISGDDPWYDQQLLVTDSPKSLSYPFDFEAPIKDGAFGRLSFLLHGGFDFPNSDQDHHVQILVNGVLVHDAVFDGFVAESGTVKVPENTLKQSNNVVEVRLPADTGTFADRVFVDQLVIGMDGPLSLDGTPSDEQVIDFAADNTVAAYHLTLGANVAAGDDIQVFAYTPNGAISEVAATLIDDQTLEFANLPAITNTTVRFAAAAVGNWHRPASVYAAETERLHNIVSDYFIIAHPTFMGQALDRFVDLKTDQGFSPVVLNWLDIVATYGFGNATPNALNNFFSKAANHSEFAHALIVGGHSYDYLGITNQPIVNFIPSHYRPVSIQNFSPTDNPYADLNRDQVPEFAIGRWPVRSVDDLESVVQKTVDWHANRADNIYQEAVLIAQAPDNRNLNFSTQMQGRVAIPLDDLDEFSQVSFVDMLTIQESGVQNPVLEGQQRIRRAVDEGANLISFAGHGSSASWGFQGLVDTEFVKSLSNVGKPVLVMPMACHTTNFESTSVNTLAHQWLFAGEQGAVAIHGASVLGEYRENAIFAERVIQQSKGSTTLGEAILKVKKLMSSGNAMLDNWALLGDPALPLR